jgi:hypothetical protein
MMKCPHRTLVYSTMQRLSAHVDRIYPDESDEKSDLDIQDEAPGDDASKNTDNIRVC